MAESVSKSVCASEPERLAVLIRQEKSMLDAEVRSSVLRAKRIGELLIEAKKVVPVGTFKKWISAETGIKYNTACLYMVVHRNWKAIEKHPDSVGMSLFNAGRVARSREPYSATYRLCSLTRLLDSLEERVADLVLDHTDLEGLSDEIHYWRARLKDAGVLKVA